MNSDALLDCALFQLSPRRTRCELFVSGDGKTEKLASGFVKPFASHMEVVEERVSSQAARLIKLEVGTGNVPQWFNKGTLERFVRFVSTPEVLELVGTFDAEMSQLEGARRMYSEGGGDLAPSSSSENETASTEATDITKKELLRAIDVRLVAVKHDLTMACARASAAGFTLDNVSELLRFADRFSAHRLNEACTKFLSLCQRHPELICHQRPESLSHQHAPSSLLPTHLKGFSDRNIRSSASSDMSIDEPEVEPSCSIKQITSSSRQPIDKINTSRPSEHAAAELATTCQQPNVQHPMENHVDKTTEEPAPSSASAETTQPGGSSSRRLSVQDRINLFESKKKEQSMSATVINSSVGGGANKVAGKPELRRLSSDASEKSVLRRWSGASDMSIDLTNSGTSCNDRKDSRSPVTLSSSANSHAQTNSKTEDEADRLKDTATSLSLLGSNAISASTYSSSSISLSEAKAGAFPKGRNGADRIIRREDTTVSKIQRLPDKEKEDWGSEVQCGASLANLQQVGLADQVASMTKSTLIPEASKLSGLKYQEGSGIQFKDVIDGHAQVKDHTILQLSPRVVTDGVKQTEQQDQVSLCSQPRTITETNLHVKDQPASMTKHKSFSIKPENARAKTEVPLDTDFQFKVALGTTEGFMPKNDPPKPSLPKLRTLSGKEKEIRRKEVPALKVTPEAISIEAEESPLQRMKLYKKAYIPDLTNKLPGTSDWKFLKEENSTIVSLGNKTKGDVQMFGPHSTASAEYVQDVRPSKGNQERNDVLQMKADELEKLFTAHKLRIHGDQTSSRRSKPLDVKVEDVPWVVERSLTEDITDHLQEVKPLNGNSSYGSEFDAKTLLKLVDNKEHNSNMKQGLGDFCPSNEVRGKFYANYMQKRDAKLKKEHVSKRPQKEAKMTEMYDSLDRIQAEMKTKFARSASQQDLDFARHRAEKIKSFSARSASKTKGQSVENFQGEEHEDLQDHDTNFPCAQDECFSDTLLGSEQTISNWSNKLSSGKLVSSSTPRTSVRSVPKPAKGSNYGSNNRRTRPENPLAQSIPNFSYFTKENMKPSIGSIKVTPRTKSKNLARSKSSIDKMNLTKEENPGRPRSMRESSDNPLELQDLSPVNSYSANKTTGLKNYEQTEPAVPNKIRSCDLRQFLTKGDSIGPGSRADIAKMKAAIASRILKSDEESEGLVDQQDNLPDMVRDEEKDSVRPSIAGDLRSLDFSVESDSEKPRLSQESGNSGDPGLGNGDALILMSQGNDALVRISSKYDISSGNMPESSGESPGSWNSHVHQSFSNTKEASDIDGSVESPIGSSPSWNSHHHNQMTETDAARMRKKWGSAQVPVLVTSASHQSHNDVTKGFKRLLKFGRKIKGTEVLANDWKSASTASESDEDTEDFHDLANQSSDDLRKPRIAFPVAAYDGSSGESGGVYPEQVESLYSSIPNPPRNLRLKEAHLSGSSLKAPRSFFSLSSFRSKGSEPKLR